MLPQDVKNTYFPSVTPPSDPEEAGRMTHNDSRYNAAFSNNDCNLNLNNEIDKHTMQCLYILKFLLSILQTTMISERPD